MGLRLFASPPSYFPPPFFFYRYKRPNHILPAPIFRTEFAPFSPFWTKLFLIPWIFVYEIDSSFLPPKSLTLEWNAFFSFFKSLPPYVFSACIVQFPPPLLQSAPYLNFSRLSLHSRCETRFSCVSFALCASALRIRKEGGVP